MTFEAVQIEEVFPTDFARKGGDEDALGAAGPNFLGGADEIGDRMSFPRTVRRGVVLGTKERVHSKIGERTSFPRTVRYGVVLVAKE